MWKIVYTKRANKDKKKLKAAGLDERAKSLVEIVRDGPFSKPPEFEPLKGNLSGSYSRRINYQHRFVYQVVAEANDTEAQKWTISDHGDGTWTLVNVGGSRCLDVDGGGC